MVAAGTKIRSTLQWADELLGIKPPAANGAAVSRRVLRRLQAIDGLPKRDQDALFRTIDAFLQARKAS